MMEASTCAVFVWLPLKEFRFVLHGVINKVINASEHSDVRAIEAAIQLAVMALFIQLIIFCDRLLDQRV